MTSPAWDPCAIAPKWCVVQRVNGRLVHVWKGIDGAVRWQVKGAKFPDEWKSSPDKRAAKREATQAARILEEVRDGR